MLTPIESKLALAARHVAEGKKVVARQRALIVREQQAGRDTFYSENLLDQFERTLAIFEDHLRQIEAETSCRPQRSGAVESIPRPVRVGESGDELAG